MSDLSVFEIIVIILLGITALKVIFSFDLNKWQERRDQRLKDRIMRTCPHTSIYLDGDNIRIESMLISPPGTVQWGCTRCGMVTYDDRLAVSLVELYRRNPKLLLRAIKKVDKLATKL